MGLDMYLFASKPFADFMRDGYTPKGVLAIEDDNDDRSLICYWRKANQIHGWFVENIQDGEDDQELYEVSIEDLKRLHREICHVLDDESTAEEYLPVTPGFFFGSYSYDEYYFNELEETKDALDVIFDALEDYDGAPQFWYTCWW